MKQRNALLLFVPMAVLAFVLLNTAGLTQPPELEEACPSSARDSDSDGLTDAYELFFGLNPANSDDANIDYDGDGLSNIEESKLLTDPFYWDTDRDGFSDLADSNAVSRAYIPWGDPQFTDGDFCEYARPDWLLGAYKAGGEWVVDTATTQSAWRVSAYGSNNVESLCVDLDRTILTNNLRYAIHYLAGNNPSLYLDLLDTNGVPVAENLFGNLLSGSNTEDSVILNIPAVKFPSSAVIQLRHGSGEIIVYEGLLYIDEDGDGLDADQERQLKTSDYCIDSNGNGINDYDECFNIGSSTNNPGGGGGGGNGGDDNGEDDDHGGHKKNKIIYVDQAIGNDTFTGRASAVFANKKGPKKTVYGGLSISETNDTIIIRSGNYNENLNISGKDVKVFIEGKVRL